MAFSHYNNISAQLPLDLSGKLIDGTVAEQTAQCLAYVKAIVESVDHAVEDIVKVNVYLADIADLAAMNEAYAAFFGDHKPARKVVGCGELPFGARDAGMTALTTKPLNIHELVALLAEYIPEK